jgi:proline iminopeptidase
LDTNTTPRQIEDIERLREHLGVERWVIYGGSWGVTLGLAYAQKHPRRVRGMVLAAVTAGRRSEIDWITRDMGRVFPREWERFRAAVPEAERDGSLSAAYARLLASPDAAVRETAARGWCAWEDTHVSLMPGWTPDPRFGDPGFRFAFARLVTHYWSNDCFLTDGELILSNMELLTGIPSVLIHGRYDVSGPLETAWSLHRTWPGSELVVLEEAGHGGTGFAEARATALERLGRRLAASEHQ